MKKKNNIKFNNGWSFAVVNGRLAEIHFAKGLGIWAHCYVKRSEFSKTDIKKYVFSYKKGFYYDKIRKLKCKVPDIKKIFPDLKTTP